MPRGVLLTPAGEALARDAQRLPGGLVDVAFLREPVEMPATLSFELPDEEPMLWSCRRSLRCLSAGTARNNGAVERFVEFVRNRMLHA
jgi:hypothetical protein